MQTAFNQFVNSNKYIREIDALYGFLKENFKQTVDLSDLLRAQIVYSVSALDSLVHEIVRIGMLNTFQGKRVKTDKFNKFSISTDTLLKIQVAINTYNMHSITPPPEYYFEQEIVLKHKHIAFQDPDKISDGLSNVWNEKYKWQVIAAKMGSNEITVKKILKNIVNRRNQIVHEADIDMQTGLRNNIIYSDVQLSTSFIEKLGLSIYDSVK